jgi:hypothetical protein
MALKTSEGRGPRGDFMTFDAVCTSSEVLVRTGERAGRYLSIRGGSKKKGEAQSHSAAEGSDTAQRMNAVRGCGSSWRQATAARFVHRTDP